MSKKISSVTVIVNSTTGTVTFVEEQDRRLSSVSERDGKDMLDAAQTAALSWILDRERP